jgi:hypothetical protein
MWEIKEEEVTERDKVIGERFKINVYARFRPLEAKKESAPESTVENEVKTHKSVTLPLHQRLSMIRVSHNFRNNSDALRVLTAEGGWFQEKWMEVSDTATTDSNKENVVDNINKKNEASKAFYTEQNDNSKKVTQTIDKLRAKKLLDKETNVVNKGIAACVQSVDQMSGRVVMVAPDVGLREFVFDSVLPAK